MTIAGDPPVLCTYDIDADLRLVSVDEGWTQFAVANGAPDLVPPAPIGSPVITRGTDATTRFIYRQLFRRAAASRKTVVFGIRCDSPEVRRFLELTIVPHDSGFTITTRLQRTEPNPGGGLLVHHPDLSSATVVRVCGWCKRIEAEGHWLELEEGLPRLGLFTWTEMPLVTHGMCEDCFSRMSVLLESL